MQIPVLLPTPAPIMDHRFQGRPVYPAVEAMEEMVRVAHEALPGLGMPHIIQARFDKFLFLDPGQHYVEALVELRQLSGDQWQAALMTRSKAPKAAITRTKIHAQLVLCDAVAPVQPWPQDVTSALEGVCRSIAPEAIYRELVPFGPAFQNIHAPLHISADGALARIKTPSQPLHVREKPCLGSSYTMDAAFHAACVWAQRHHGIVAFPVALERRTVLMPTLPDRVYVARILPVKAVDELLFFDIRILDENGALCEAAEGVQMRDVSAGRLKPPAWIRQSDPDDPLINLRPHCRELITVVLDAVAPFATTVLSVEERERYDKMGIARRKGYLAGRLALKRLWRRCNGDDRIIAAAEIQTLRNHSPLPCCNYGNFEFPLHLSLAHDKHFAVAVCNQNPVGVDVERISEQARKSSRIFMDEAERRLAQESTMGAMEASIRIWSVKEAVAKAMGINLAEAWQRVRVTEISRDRSQFFFDKKTMKAVHAVADGHLFSLVTET